MCIALPASSVPIISDGLQWTDIKTSCIPGEPRYCEHSWPKTECPLQGRPSFHTAHDSTVRRGQGASPISANDSSTTISDAGVSTVVSSAYAAKANGSKDSEHSIISPNEQWIFSATITRSGSVRLYHPCMQGSSQSSKQTQFSSSDGREKWSFSSDDFGDGATGFYKERPEAR